MYTHTVWVCMYIGVGCLYTYSGRLLGTGVDWAWRFCRMQEGGEGGEKGVVVGGGGRGGLERGGCPAHTFCFDEESRMHVCVEVVRLFAARDLVGTTPPWPLERRVVETSTVGFTFL